jgi:hypothetical protein
MPKKVLHAERFSVFTETANLANLGFSIHEGECLSLGVPDKDERRLLLLSLLGIVPLTDGILRLNDLSIEEESPYVRLATGLSLVLPQEVAKELLPDDRVFRPSILGYNKFFWGQPDKDFPWNGDKKLLRNFRKNYKVYTKVGSKPNLIINYQLEDMDSDIFKIYMSSLEQFKEEGGSVLTIDEHFCSKRCMNQAGLISKGKMLGIVENQEEDMERLSLIGGAKKDA